MNLENEKISKRQLGRMIFYDFFGLSTLVLPGYLAKETGIDGFFAIILGSVVGFLFLLMVLRIMRNIKTDYSDLLRGQLGKILSCMMFIVYGVTALFGCAYGLQMLGGVMGEYLIGDTPMWLIMAVLAILAVYGLGAGLECRGRMYEVIFWFVVIPLILLFGMAALDVDPEGWVPVLHSSSSQMLRSGYVVFAMLGSVAYLPMLSDGINENGKKGVTSACKRSYIWSVVILMVLYLLLTGIFQPPTMAVMKSPVLTLTAMVKVPGGFLERQDALLCGIWFISIFAFIENSMYYQTWCMHAVIKKNAQGWFLFGSGVLTYVLGMIMYANAYFKRILCQYYLWIGVPVLAVITILAWLTGRRFKQTKSQSQLKMQTARTAGKTCKEEMRCVVLVLLAGFEMLLTGCGQMEIEERAFPLALAIAPAQEDELYEFSFYFEDVNPGEDRIYHKEDEKVVARGYAQAYTLFQRQQAAQLDDSHLKVLLLSRKLLEDEAFLDDFYGYFMREDHFSWNTMVYLTDESSAELEELKEHTGGRLGTYLRDMAESDAQEKTAAVPTLGDLYKEYNNHRKVLLLPVLGSTDVPMVDSYVMLVYGRPGGTLSVDEARLLELLQGRLKNFEMELADGVVIELDGIHIMRTRIPDTSKERWKATLSARCHVENRSLGSELPSNQVREAGEQLLREQMEKAEPWTGFVGAEGSWIIPEYELKLYWRE